MGLVQLFVAVCCITYVTSTQVSPDNIEMERFTAADSKNSRVSTSGTYKTIRDNIAAPSARASNVVYGKSKAPKPGPGAYVAPHLKNKPIISKFKPSQEDTGYDTDPVNTYAHGYKPTAQETAALQKYMQRYASQIITASNSPKLSDPYKKYNIPTQKYKFIPVISSEPKPIAVSGEKLKDHDTVEVGTEKYQSYQVHQQVSVQPAKIQKSPPKKAYSFDSAQQSTDFKYTSQDSHLASQLMAEPEKESWSHYEPYQYGIVPQDKVGELSKITGYKIPAATSITLGHSVETKEEEKHEHEEHDYPPHDPKYEYMYQVHDPEKHNNFGHSEARKGKTTWGRYYVQLPDGRLETVKYWVDKSGYHAEVDFKGKAKHPSHKEYDHHEEPKVETKTEEVGLGGHSETSYSLSEAVEEY